MYPLTQKWRYYKLHAWIKLNLPPLIKPDGGYLLPAFAGTGFAGMTLLKIVIAKGRRPCGNLGGSGAQPVAMSRYGGVIVPPVVMYSQ